MRDTAMIAPHSVELEQQVLGAVMADNERFHAIGGIVRAEHFFDPVHATIWNTLHDRVRKDHMATPVTLAVDLEHHAGLKELGGPAYLARLVAASISGNAIKDYAAELVALAGRRAMLDEMKQVTEYLQSGMDLSEAKAGLELFLHKQAADDAAPRTMSMLKAQTIAAQNRLDLAEGKQVAIPSGLSSLDEILTLSPQRYTMLGAQTSMGKTALAIFIARHAAQAGFGTGFVTLEMPESDVASRFNSIETEIPYKAYDRPMSENVLRKTVEAAKSLESLPVELFSSRVRDVPSILAEGKRLALHMQPNGAFKGFKLLIVDYIQLVRGRGESSVVRLSQVANDFKQVAKQLDVHVLALAQVNRSIGAREDRRPGLADLRGSGDLEMAPDNVVFIHRPEYYFQRETPPTKAEERADWEADAARWRGKAEIIVGKARMGEITTIEIGCDMATNRFWDLTDQYQQEDLAF